MNTDFQPVRNSQEHQAALERLEVYLSRLHFVDRFLSDEIRLQAVARAETRVSGISSMPIVEEGLKLIDHWFVDAKPSSGTSRKAARLRLVLDPEKHPVTFRALHPKAGFEGADIPGRLMICPPLRVTRMVSNSEPGDPQGAWTPSILKVLAAIFVGLLGWMFMVP